MTMVGLKCWRSWTALCICRHIPDFVNLVHLVGSYPSVWKQGS
uniref:Uncharacterized protein n=1 Tax=Arundo donax TaxID=35708 RepID=A0A0A9B245_ARUDO